MQRYTLKFNFQIKFYFFIENLCFCSLKIAVCALKIPIGRKKLKIHIRLKITAESKNYYLKIPVRACMRVCIANSHQDTRQRPAHDRHTSGTHDRQKSEEHQQAEKPVYICLITDNEKKVKKS